MWMLIILLAAFALLLTFGLVTESRARRVRHRALSAAEVSAGADRRHPPTLAVLLPYDDRSLARRVGRAETRSYMTLFLRSW